MKARITQLSLLFVALQMISTAFYLSCIALLAMAALDGFSGSEGAMILLGVDMPWLCLGLLVGSILLQIVWRERGKPIWRNGPQ